MSANCNVMCPIVGWARAAFCPTCPGNTIRPHLKEIYEAESAFAGDWSDDPNCDSVDPGFVFQKFVGCGSGGLLKERQREEE
jgi:hypothetical protein